jgi:hypothetical protein
MTASKQSQDGMQNKIGIFSASGWLFKKKSVTVHGNMNVKSFIVFDIVLASCAPCTLTVSVCTVLQDQPKSNRSALCTDMQTFCCAASSEQKNMPQIQVCKVQNIIFITNLPAVSLRSMIVPSKVHPDSVLKS